jgi:Ankyrin repeats (many copies)/Ankyrin repeats (3 copies)
MINYLCSLPEASINSKTNIGATALTYAAIGMSIESLETSPNAMTVRRLIERKAEIDIVQEKDSPTTLFYAAATRNYKAAAYLLEHKAQINYTDSLQYISVLEEAILSKSYPLIRLLLHCSCDVNHVSNFGNSPLIFAIKFKSNLSIFKLLLENGAQLEQKDRRGKTAFDLVAKGNRRDLQNLFQRYAAKTRFSYLVGAINVALASVMPLLNGHPYEKPMRSICNELLTLVKTRSERLDDEVKNVMRKLLKFLGSNKKPENQLPEWLFKSLKRALKQEKSLKELISLRYSEHSSILVAGHRSAVADSALEHQKMGGGSK